jgi:hypothetical protein
MGRSQLDFCFTVALKTFFWFFFAWGLIKAEAVEKPALLPFFFFFDRQKPRTPLAELLGLPPPPPCRGAPGRGRFLETERRQLGGGGGGNGGRGGGQL